MQKFKKKAWFVRHPEYGLAVVVAPDREQASLAAAEWWGAPWAKVAADLDIKPAPDVQNNVCYSCGRYIQSKDLRCRDCEQKLRGAMRKPGWDGKGRRKAEKIRKWQEVRYERAGGKNAPSA